MSQTAGTAPQQGRFAQWLDNQGIAKPLRWGFIGLILFMVGDGIEQSFMSPYLVERGFSVGEVATLFSAYGIVVAVGAWLAGALAEAWGPRRVMLIGAALWLVLQVVYLGLGVMQDNLTVMIASYAIRAIGYPFFAYGFLVWVTMDSPAAKMGKAVGWYWFANAMGLGVISSYLGAIVIPLIGELATLWLTLAFVAAGGLVIATLVKTRSGAQPVTARDTIQGLTKSVTIIKDQPKVGIGGVVRLINTISFYSFAVFLSVHMINEIGFTVSQWATIWGTMLAANVAANLVAGYASDWFGRINTIAWGGGVLTAVSIVALYYVPEAIGPNFPVVMGIGIVYGVGLAMYVPLSAVVPLLAPHNKAAAVAVLNLGAGLSNFGGPVLAGLVGPLGIAPVVWIIVGLYLVGTVLTFMLRAPGIEADDADIAELAAADEITLEQAEARADGQPRTGTAGAAL